MVHAFVVGSGPNGLAAAAVLARAGLAVTVLEAQEKVGGGSRSAEMTLPGLIHDHCAAIHPLARHNPLLRYLTSNDCAPLEWLYPSVQCAHPLIHPTHGDSPPGSSGGALYQDVHTTARQFRTAHDRAQWERLFNPLASNFAGLASGILHPPLVLPRQLFTPSGTHNSSQPPSLPQRKAITSTWKNLLRFGLPASLSASTTARRWRSLEARALFAGVAAHAFRPLTRPGSSAIGMLLTTAAQADGWPVARGGAQTIIDALADAVKQSGGEITTGVTVRSLDDINPGANDIVMLDTTPQAVLRIIDASRHSPHIPFPVRAALSRYKYGPGVAVVNFAIDGGIPWRYGPAHHAGTVHLGGSLSDIHIAEQEVNRGRLPEHPFVLVAQQYVADPSRSNGNLNPIDAYAHVPAEYAGSPSVICACIEDEIERYAPGFRERVVAKKIRMPVDIERDNANFVGGNITTGANTLRGLLGRPRVSPNPYLVCSHDSGGPCVYLCSAATPPGAGAHGLCGVLAAQAALRRVP